MKSDRSDGDPAPHWKRHPTALSFVAAHPLDESSIIRLFSRGPLCTLRCSVAVFRAELAPLPRRSRARLPRAGLDLETAPPGAGMPTTASSSRWLTPVPAAGAFGRRGPWRARHLLRVGFRTSSLLNESSRRRLAPAMTAGAPRIVSPLPNPRAVRLRHRELSGAFARFFLLFDWEAASSMCALEAVGATVPATRPPGDPAANRLCPRDRRGRIAPAWSGTVRVGAACVGRSSRRKGALRSPSLRNAMVDAKLVNRRRLGRGLYAEEVAHARPTVWSSWAPGWRMHENSECPGFDLLSVPPVASPRMLGTVAARRTTAPSAGNASFGRRTLRRPASSE